VNASNPSAFGAELRRRREQAGLSQTTLGARLHRTRQAISAWERSVSLPDDRDAQRLDSALNGRGELVQIWRRARLVERAVRDETDLAEVLTTNRREFSFAALAALSHVAATTRQRISGHGDATATLADLESDVDEVAQIYGSAPPAELLPRVGEQWQQIERILDGRLSEQARRRATLVGGQLVYFLGRLAFNVNDMRASRRFAELAGAYAEEVGEPVLQLSVAALHSSVAYWTGRYGLALSHLDAVAGIRDPYMNARIAAYRARALANLNRVGEARAALDAMEAAADDFAPLPGETPVGPGAVAMFRSGIGLIIGDPDAGTWADTALSAYQQGGGDYTVEEYQHAQLNRAIAHRAAAPDAAALTATAMLHGLATRPTHTVNTKVRRLVGDLYKHRSLPEVRDLADRYRALPAAVVV